MKRRLLLGLAAAALPMLSPAAPLRDLSAGQTGRFEYESITPPNRHLYARQLLAGTTVATISAELLMPKGIPKDTKVPAVVLSHGSGGVESNLYDVWAKELTAAGYAVLIADSYKPRGPILRLMQRASSISAFHGAVALRLIRLGPHGQTQSTPAR